MNRVDPGVEKKFLEAQAWYEKGDYGEALKILLELEESEVNLPNVYFYLGLLYNFKFNDIAKTSYYYKKALKSDPAFSPTYYNYASFLQNNSCFDELEIFLKEMEKKLPVAQADIYFEYAVMRETQQRYDEALKYYDLAYQNAINPDFVQRIKDFRSRCFEKRRKSTFLGKIDIGPGVLVVIVAFVLFLSTLIPLFQGN